jgi:hypothetical protein
MEKLRIIVGGYIGLYPTGGATWDYIQYPIGLQNLGHDVYYIEDTMQYPVFQKEGSDWDDASACINYLKDAMEAFGLKDKWAYRDVATGNSFGMTEEKILELCRSADIFINISCSTYLRPEYLKIPKRILIDSDPMFTQMQYALELQGGGGSEAWSTKQMLEDHNYLFTFGENITAPGCRIPTFQFTWHTTRQPICLHLWNNGAGIPGKAFTSIMNWSGRKKLEYANETWGQKDVEFEKFKDIPCLLKKENFEVVVNRPLNKESSFDETGLKQLGWKIIDPAHAVASTVDYKNFILGSHAEFGVAKETYVKANTGWFSCRSACYLAAGKPVITQETQWSKYIPSGSGLFAFNETASAIAAINQVQADYKKHCIAAREIAAVYFDSSKVLTRMLDIIN